MSAGPESWTREGRATLEGSGEDGRRNGALASLGFAFAKGVASQQAFFAALSENLLSRTTQEEDGRRGRRHRLTDGVVMWRGRLYFYFI